MNGEPGVGVVHRTSDGADENRCSVSQVGKANGELSDGAAVRVYLVSTKQLRLIRQSGTTHS